MDLQAVWQRVMRAVRMEQGVFAEIGSDSAATGQAIVVTGGAALVSGLAAIWPGGQDFNVFGWIIGAAVTATVGLAIGVGILFLVSRLFGATGSYESLFRAGGFAFAPTALGIVPFIGGIAGAIWSLILAIRAVKETQGVSDGAAVAIVLIPAAIGFVIALILALIVGFALLGMRVAG